MVRTAHKHVAQRAGKREALCVALKSLRASATKSRDIRGHVGYCPAAQRRWYGTKAYWATIYLKYRRKKEPEEIKEEKEPPIQTWRRMARIVRLLCAVCIALRKYAMEAGLMENYMVAVTTRKSNKTGEGSEMEELTFNLQDFKINKELQVPKQLIGLMEKRPGERTSDDILSIARLMRNLPSFKKYTRDMQHMMCKIVRYMKCGKRRVVLRKGHVGFSVYFIYTGSVSVVLDKDDQTIFSKPEVVILRKGACFGEIALLQNTRRNATVVCAEEAEFLTIDKEDFVANGLHLQMKDEFTHRFNFFRAWSPLEDWTDDAVDNLSYVSRTEDFSHNKVVVRDSRQNEWLWFVVQGSCDVLRVVDLEKSSYYQTLLTLHLQTVQERSKSAPLHADRIMSAPTRATAMRTRRDGIRPHTSIGIHVDEVDDEEDNKEEEEHKEDGCKQDAVEGGKGSATDNEEAGSAASMRRLSEAVQRVLVASSQPKLLDDEEIRTGIYLRVDTLRDGQCFGLEGLFEDDADFLYGKQRYSMVSKGCTLIHVPRAKFKELADDKILNRIRNKIKDYPTDHELCDSFLKKSKWDYFKHSIVENVITGVHNNVTFENSLRNFKQKEYSSRCDFDHVTTQLYTPLTAYSHSALIGSYALTPTDKAALPSKRIKSAVESRRPRTVIETLIPPSSLQRARQEHEANSRRPRPRTCPPSSVANKRRWLTRTAHTPVAVHPTTSRSRAPSANHLCPNAHAVAHAPQPLAVDSRPRSVVLAQRLAGSRPASPVSAASLKSSAIAAHRRLQNAERHAEQHTEPRRDNRKEIRLQRTDVLTGSHRRPLVLAQMRS